MKASATGQDRQAIALEVGYLQGRISAFGACLKGTGCEGIVMAGNVLVGLKSADGLTGKSGSKAVGEAEQVPSKAMVDVPENYHDAKTPDKTVEKPPTARPSIDPSPPVAEYPNGVKLYPDGSLRTPDGKFASVSGSAAPGTAKAAEFAEFLQSNGVKVIGTEMEVQGPLGARRYDIVIEGADGKLQGVEIKSGGAAKGSYQDFTDRFVNEFGAKGVGRLSGKTVSSTITIFVK